MTMRVAVGEAAGVRGTAECGPAARSSADCFQVRSMAARIRTAHRTGPPELASVPVHLLLSHCCNYRKGVRMFYSRGSGTARRARWLDGGVRCCDSSLDTQQSAGAGMSGRGVQRGAR